MLVAPCCVKWLVPARILGQKWLMTPWKEARDYRTSTIVLVVTNLIPIIGVFLWDWSAFDVIALYWVENVIIGLINVLKMVTCNPNFEEIDVLVQLRERLKASQSEAISSGGGATANQERLKQQIEKLSKNSGCATHGSKLFIVPFFTVHYGGFCLGHGMFILILLGGAVGGIGHAPPTSMEDGIEAIVDLVFSGTGLVFALALLASHLFSFFVNYIGKGEYRRTLVPALMFAPYSRIIVLHIAILVGGFAIVALGSPKFMVLLLVIGKIGIDLKLHLRSHRKLNPAFGADVRAPF